MSFIWLADVPILNYLVGTAHELQVVTFEEVDQHVGAEGKGHPPLLIMRKADLPRSGVGPEEITRQPVRSR